MTQIAKAVLKLNLEIQIDHTSDITHKMSIIFNNIVFGLVGDTSFGNREASLPEKKCCRCNHTAWKKQGEYKYEYNIQSYIWYQSSNNKYLCLSCVEDKKME